MKPKSRLPGNCATAIGALTVMLIAGATAAQQPPKQYRIGYLSASTAKSFKSRVDALKHGLRDLGYVQGRNTVVEERYAQGRPDRLHALARELVALKVDLIVIHGTSAVRAARAVAGSTPIVFAVVSDPVGSGFVRSLALPGGNITGVTDYHTHLVPKRLALLRELLPAARRIAVFWHPEARNTVGQLDTLRTVAPRMGVSILAHQFKDTADFERAADAFRDRRPDALNVLGYALISVYRHQIAAFALKHRLPSISTTASSVEAGFLMSYGVRMEDLNYRAATIVDKILKGADPARLPVELPTRFYLAINLKTAKALGIAIPPSILLRADRLIE